MTRKATILLTALALLLPFSTAHAVGQWSFGVNGGVGIPVGNFSSSDSTGLEAKTGITFGGEVDYHTGGKLAIGLDGGFNTNKHKGEGDVLDLGGGQTLTAVKDKFKITHFGAHAKYKFSPGSKASPYGVLGLGIYDLKEDYDYAFDDGSTVVHFTDESDNVEQPGSRIGGRIGLGALIHASNSIGVSLESDYNYIKMDKDKFGIGSLAYVGVRGGITLILQPSAGSQ